MLYTSYMRGKRTENHAAGRSTKPVCLDTRENKAFAANEGRASTTTGPPPTRFRLQCCLREPRGPMNCRSLRQRTERREITRSPKSLSPIDGRPASGSACDVYCSVHL
jgi:hypothetical protein